VQDVVERSREKSNMLQGFGDAVLRAEALEDQLMKSRKHAAAMQSKLDTVGHTPRVLVQGRKNSRRRTPGRIPLYSY
jgi:hypothetical protein